MPRTIKVAIAGKMKSGKDSLAAALSKQLEVPVDRFAAPLKEAGAALGFGDGEVVKSRAFLQDIAGTITRQYPWHFTALLESRCGQTLLDSVGPGVIITDLRRLQEYIWAKTRGFVLVSLWVPREVQIARGAEPDRLDHETETAFDGAPWGTWDLYINSHQRTVDEEVAMVMAVLEQRGMLRDKPPLPWRSYG